MKDNNLIIYKNNEGNIIVDAISKHLKNIFTALL